MQRPGFWILAATAVSAGALFFVVAISSSRDQARPSADARGHARALQSKTPSVTASGVAPRPAIAVESAAKSAEPGEPTTATQRARGQALVREIEAMLNNSADSGREEKVAGLLTDLIARDPVVAAHLAKILRLGPARAALLRLMAQAWTRIDFGGAIAWAATLDDAVERTHAFSTACFEDAKTRPAEAVDAWMAFDPTPSDPALANLIQVWAETELPAALAWARTQPAGAARDQALARVAFVLSQTEPAEAATLVAESVDPGPAQTEAVLSVLHQWATRDLPAARAWVERFPAGPLAARAKRELDGIERYTEMAAVKG
jgi:hypothetical protein